ncbi:Uncharacterized protein TCM_024931 [Theobroma cacao]|uniref:Uncharacterized protein n=1 Tax=Theobroma cacao TaxID=3641 RepID=A0A061EWN6_THECC|nr:Uncharacterized protein TCM_024931 [Theobroma cacao]
MWKAKTLSMGGRLTLLRLVLSSLLLFYMSLFRMPKKVKCEIEKIQKRFLWGGLNLVCRLHCVSWGSICNYHELGGLGLVDIEVKNNAVLNKWLWRYENEPKGLWRCIVAEKLSLDQKSLTPNLQNNVRIFEIWRNIVKPLYGGDTFSSYIIEGLGVSLGSESRIKF